MEITTFDQWLNTLSSALDRAKNVGMGQDMIQRSAVQLGDYLYSNVNPDAPENSMLKALWEVADNQEKQAIANTLIKLTERYHKH